MPDHKSPFDFLRNKPALVVTALLTVEIGLFYGMPTKEYIPSPPPLDDFARRVGPWTMTGQFPIDEASQKLLQADDTLTRDYGGPVDVNLFVAFFKSQRAGVTPHSPKMCLPANGWSEEGSTILSVKVPGEAAPIPVNRYIVSKDGQRELVLYWFQNWHRATADEYLSRFFLLYDSVRYRRSDEALVRVVARIDGSDDGKSEQGALRFLQDIYQPLKEQIWSAPQHVALLP